MKEVLEKFSKRVLMLERDYQKGCMDRIEYAMFLYDALKELREDMAKCL